MASLVRLLPPHWRDKERSTYPHRVLPQQYFCIYAFEGDGVIVLLPCSLKDIQVILYVFITANCVEI